MELVNALNELQTTIEAMAIYLPLAFFIPIGLMVIIGIIQLINQR